MSLNTMTKENGSIADQSKKICENLRETICPRYNTLFPLNKMLPFLYSYIIEWKT